MRRGRLIVISGPSGVGKSTVLKAVMEQIPGLRFSVSATTRAPRPGEQDGVNYYFVDRARFESMVQCNELLEHAYYAGNYYGTPEKPLDHLLEQGIDVLLDIEPQGALQVRGRRPDAVLIFVAAPSFPELRRRLIGRGDTKAEDVQVRLEHARWEYRQAQKYDYIVVNDQLDRCVLEVESIIIAEKCKTENREHVLKEEL